MKNPFTTEEVENALKKLKFNKSPCIDKITAEYLRYGPPEKNSRNNKTNLQRN